MSTIPIPIPIVSDKKYKKFVADNGEIIEASCDDMIKFIRSCYVPNHEIVINEELLRLRLSKYIFNKS